MTRLFSYILKIDSGAAPNPFGGICTLTICKPVIRRCATVNDWVIGIGSVSTQVSKGKFESLANRLIYAMKISKIESMEEYDTDCKTNYRTKIPQWKNNDWKLRVGDCIYDYSQGSQPTQRKSVHYEGDRERDLKGKNALLSDCFYYFGNEAPQIPDDLKEIVHKHIGHKRVIDQSIISKFEAWIGGFEKNKLYGQPIQAWMYEQQTVDDKGCKGANKCAKNVKITDAPCKKGCC